MPQSFTTLAQPSHFTLEEKRSRFITHIYPVNDKSQGSALLEALIQKYPDARHYCTAYVIGNPEQAQAAGFNDDGEPGGTAGKPMLNVLMQRKVGNVYAVVVRYFGGIKLGAGGLTRAYGAAVSGALDNAQLLEVFPSCEFMVEVPFALEERVRNILTKKLVVNITTEYTHAVTLTVTCERRILDQLCTDITNQTAGQARVTRPD